MWDGSLRVQGVKLRSPTKMCKNVVPRGVNIPGICPENTWNIPGPSKCPQDEHPGFKQAGPSHTKLSVPVEGGFR